MSTNRQSSRALRIQPQRVSKQSRRVSRRTGTVWAAFIGAMTLVGGGLHLAGGGKVFRSGAPKVQPMVATTTTGAQGLEAIFSAPKAVQAGRWQAIVIHDTGEQVGTPASLDERAKRLGLRGLGVHFVIGNGNGMQDGELFVGERWLDQTPGAHAAGDAADWLNRNAIGITLVGDGNRNHFSRAQVARLEDLVVMLSQRLGIPADRIYLHSQVAPTTSPGKLFPDGSLRARLMAAGIR